MDTDTYEALKSVYLSTKKHIIMDDWDDAYNAGIRHAVNHVMLRHYTSIKVDEIQRGWQEELKKETDDGT